MTNEELRYLVANYEAELKNWRVLKFEYNKFVCVRSDGTGQTFNDAYYAENYPKEEAMRSVLQAYHKALDAKARK